ncbi:Putative transposase, Tc1, ribonuclease H superfamily [Colletotrichum destructivum]|uniref:Transposase, Tc1, ribonuclease H superfamily n=1 Tax=Colletotrichum destructivum TaxID=34406 RepID=A0AAX4J5M9_9PEZI|nr:Putative transposase, Tc1, ribonuclease H superfamily [Colletotrichum destructivum]
MPESRRVPQRNTTVGCQKSARIHYRATYQQLMKDWHGQISIRTFKRVLRGGGSRKWRAMKRPFISEQAARIRLAFAREWHSKVEELMQANISIMVWGMVWAEGRSDLVFLIQDSTSRRQGYSSNSYISCLEEGNLPYSDDTRHFMQDNASIHNAAKTPPCSPDLNPIEHVWKLMKDNLRRLYPEPFNYGRNELDTSKFKEQLTAAWEAFPQESIRSLIQSLPRRLEAVIRAQGWYT